MENVLYSKCSLERKEQYKIITSIIEKGGEKIVKKKAATFSAKNHIERMYQKAKNGLINCHQDIRLVNVQMVAEDGLEFEYIKGKSFADVLQEDVTTECWERFYKHIEQLKDWIFGVSNVQTFKSTEQFEEVFGKENLEGTLAAKNINIDLIPENIIICDGKPVMIDYEWIFECLIPLKYVLFRAIFFTGVFNDLSNSRKEKVREITEISKDEEIVFVRMEKKFQQYISGKTLQDLYGELGKSNYIISEDKLSDEVLKIQILDEKDSVLYEEMTRSTDINIKLKLNNSQKIYVNIFETSSIMKILEERNESGNPLKRLEINSIVNVFDDFYFDDFVKISYEVEGMKEAELSYQILNRNDNLIGMLANAFVELQKLRGDCAEKEKWNNAYQNKIEQLENKLLRVGDERNEAINQNGKYLVRANSQKELIDKQKSEMLNLQEKIKDIERSFEKLKDDYNELSEKMEKTLGYRIRNKFRKSRN